MTEPDVDPGWWQCDGCNGDVRPKNAHTKEVPGPDGTEILAFCDRCWDDE